MKKRIVRETLISGRVQYRVEKLSFFGIGKSWVTDTFYDGFRDMHFDAVFETLAEAEIHAYGNYHQSTAEQVVKREILVTTKETAL